MVGLWATVLQKYKEQVIWYNELIRKQMIMSDEIAAILTNNKRDKPLQEIPPYDLNNDTYKDYYPLLVNMYILDNYVKNALWDLGIIDTITCIINMELVADIKSKNRAYIGKKP